MDIIKKKLPSNNNSSGSISSQAECESSRNSQTSIPCQQSSSLHRLHKLNLPTFTGEVTQWQTQTFWDSYASSIHNNASLSEIQKFSYLRSLLQGSAEKCVDGFPLTNANYTKAIELLHERYGQPHKITASYMQALLDLAPTTSHLTDLRDFSDKVEVYVRGLDALGKQEETYSTLLIPITMGKLPSDVLRNMTREHGD